MSINAIDNSAMEKLDMDKSAMERTPPTAAPAWHENIAVMDLKIVLTTGLFILTVGFALLPLKCMKLARRGSINQRQKYETILGLLNCLAGGVFLGACFLDLFPDVKEAIDGATHDLGIHSHFPIAEFIMLYGLFMVLSIEQIAMHFQKLGLAPPIGGHGHSHGGPPAEHSHGGPPKKHSQTKETKLTKATKPPSGSVHSEKFPACEMDNIPECGDECEGEEDREMKSVVKFNKKQGKATLVEPERRERTPSIVMLRIRGAGSFLNEIPSQATPPPDDEAPQENGHSSINHSHQHHSHKGEEPPEAHSSMRAVLLLVALSLHSLFEGLALGLLEQKDDIINIFAALMMHKLVMGFSLGLNLVQSDMKLWTIISSACTFSITSPIGAAIGIAVAETYHTPTSQLFTGGLQGIACGTFLYVTFFEVLPNEMREGAEGNRILKLLSILLGFSFIAVMTLALPHHDDGGHEH